jgi:hypothetical protein
MITPPKGSNKNKAVARGKHVLACQPHDATTRLDFVSPGCDGFVGYIFAPRGTFEVEFYDLIRVDHRLQ